MVKNSRKASYEDSQQEIHNSLAAQHSQAHAVLNESVAATVNVLSRLLSSWNAQQGFWESENVGEKIALMHSELSEALEADRKDLPSDHIEGFTGVEEELADVMIRVLDFAGHFDLRLAEALNAKIQFNLSRPFKHGKAY